MANSFRLMSLAAVWRKTRRRLKASSFPAFRQLSREKRAIIPP
jgi:hypothetical protein